MDDGGRNEWSRLLAESLRANADDAPSDDGLLSSVRLRSSRYRRRRIATVLAAAVVTLAVVVPAALLSAARTDRTGPAPAAPDPQRLVAEFSAPAFPYTLAASAGLRPPVASMRDGDLIAFFEAPEPLHHADTTVTVSARPPASAGDPISVRVRGRTGTLTTVDREPARQLSLVWSEAGRWIRLATDDTYTPQQVVQLAEALVPASIPVLPPFRLDLSPAGLEVSTVTQSRISFGALEVILRKRRPLGATDRTVGPYPASLTRGPAGTTLDVDVTDWDATLEIRAASSLGLDDAQLLRFAAGVHILNRSDPE
ncbi:hypothetical protein GCM10010172_40420 [Paractinoplanes ferrugineus]|uniref:Uncharacterized protein n=1 Tax=Paractinoplanes ferrugineus TaxID=113564 RepID=A0A919JAT1_9ACTN|nr:hypothetical protein [Actinoplanes ferrugineus]GIE16649.1 hypothetical protein Afe05nite_84890 [Actinoplanes ferrugineus]